MQCIHMMGVMGVFFIGAWLILNTLALLQLLNILIILEQVALSQGNARVRLKVILKLFLIYKSITVVHKFRVNCQINL